MSDEIIRIEITDSDIDEVELLFGNVKFDTQRRNILKYMNSVDIQAYPGAGKTTVLVAKLAILVKKWPYRNKGICVLSHTNSARNEIELRLGNTDIGKSLLSYPHFIGTVHSFFDNFAGSIWLKSNNYPITLIDDEVVLNRRDSKLGWGTRKYFECKNLSYNNCGSQSFPVISINIGCRNNTTSYRDLYNTIEQSFELGYFTFDEILYISKYAIEEYEWLPSALQERFPFFFIDEEQDMSKLQWLLVKTCFPAMSSSICQFFGDANQAIYNSYGSEANNIFPMGEPLRISDSHRFGDSIAKLVDPLGIVIPGLTGGASLFKQLDNKHAIFLFDDAKDVLPAYAEYLLSCFSDEVINGELPCYAVGMVHNNDKRQIDKKKYPIGVGAYYSSYDPDVSKATYTPRLFIDFFYIGKKLFNQTGDYYSLVEKIAEGIRKYIRVKTDIQISSFGGAYYSLINLVNDEKKKYFRKDFCKLLNFQIDTKEMWNSVVDYVQAFMNSYYGINSFDENYFKWFNNVSSSEMDIALNHNMKNVYIYEKGGRKVSVYISSIHTVKGRTHLATLVLDTFWYDRNIKSILPWLIKKPMKKPGKRDFARLKCHYVALTRARGLICIAALKKSIANSDVDMLKGVGWNIIEL
ncbi:MAG: UvrD-helicase domain-containing protein [Clostridiales bacterium]|nr:UvrD-helicase domain-containing protein [Clostridiales bacterium]